MDKVTSTINEAYENCYVGSNTEWRLLSARAKAQNIVDVCKDISFKKVLEVGAGDGSILQYLDEWGFSNEMYALEIVESAAELIKKRNLKSVVEVKLFDGYQIPYPDSFFDVVILSHVLEHVEHERLVIRELKRVSKYIVIEVPLDYRFGVENRMKHFLAYGHINMYTPSLIRFLLKTEALDIRADKTSLIPPATTKYNEFVNKKAPKSMLKSLKIDLEYKVKKVLGSLLGQNRTEKFANAYTILTEKSDRKLEIF